MAGRDGDGSWHVFGWRGVRMDKNAVEKEEKEEKR